MKPEPQGRDKTPDLDYWNQPMRPFTRLECILMTVFIFGLYLFFGGSPWT